MDLPPHLTALVEHDQDQAASFASLTSPVRGLASHVTDLTSTVARVSAENAHLSSEVQRLGRELRAEQMTIVELSKAAAPGGHWVREPSTGANDPGGTWVWSLEKHKHAVPTVAFGPPASLLSLPTELIRMIIDELPSEERPKLCSVCMLILQHTSAILKRNPLELKGQSALDFLCHRLADPGTKSARITRLLLPTEVRFKGKPPRHISRFFADRLGTTPPHSTVRIEVLALAQSSIQSIISWVPVLSRCNPRRFWLLTGDVSQQRALPTIASEYAHHVAYFSASWDRLIEMSSRGPGSLLLLPGEEGSELAIGECLRRSSPEKRMGPLIATVRRDVGLEERRSLVVEEKDLRRFFEPESSIRPGGTDWRLSVTI